MRQGPLPRLASSMKTSIALALCMSACISMPQPIQTASPAQIQDQQRAAMAQSMGYPTKKSPAELEDMVRKQTKDFKLMTKDGEGRLDAPAAFTINGVKGTCYTIVMRLADGAAWGLGAQAGLRFDFRSPT